MTNSMKKAIGVSLAAVLALGVGFTPMSATAQSGTSDTLVQGGFSLPRSHHYQTYDAKHGSYVDVGVDSVPGRLANKEPVYDRTAQVWVYHSSTGGLNPMYQTSTAAASSGNQGDWQRIHGQVQSVSGNTVNFKADDGRMLTVDAGQVSGDIRSSLAANEGATLIGFAGASANQFRAQYIQKDSSDPSRGGTVAGQASSGSSPAASPTTSVDEQSWQRIHGTVNSASGTTLSLKTDDGRMLNVDTKGVDQGVRQSLTNGENVTVIGFYHGDQNNVTAKFVQKDSSAK